MPIVFACPECGREVGAEGLSPGLEVQCEGCSTWVEIPFLPRAGAPKAGSQAPRRSPWASNTLRGAVAFAAFTLLALAATRMIGKQVRSGRERVLAELVASANEAESARRYDVALRELEGALAHARSFEREGSATLRELAARRDRVSLLEARERLARVDSLDPEAAVGESLILAGRAARDRALAPLADEIEARLAGSRERRAEVDLTRAHQALDSGRDGEAAALAERLYDRARELSDPESRKYRDEAEAVLESAVRRSGVALPPAEGRFAAGSPEDYAAKLDRIRADALKARGYLPQPRRSPWARLWDEKAPFVQKLHVVETHDELYLQSSNRSSTIDGTFELSHEGALIWKARSVCKTRSPLPDLPAYRAGHLATAPRRLPEIERTFHDDALAQFAEQAIRNLRGLPTREAAAEKD